MGYNPEKHHRRSIRLKDYDYSSEGCYFITLCTQKREFLFGDIEDGKMILNEYGKIVDLIWNKLPERYPIEIDGYVVMPNHFHGIVNIKNREEVSKNKVGAIHVSTLLKLPQRSAAEIKNRRIMILPKVIGYFKMNSAKQINKLRNASVISIWQRNYFERVIRDEKELNRIRLYIQNNPGQWQDDKYFN